MNQGKQFVRHDEPTLSTQANLVYAMSQLAGAMSHVERTLCDHENGRPENNAEHS